jgi:hypothetical protein
MLDLLWLPPSALTKRPTAPTGPTPGFRSETGTRTGGPMRERAEADGRGAAIRTGGPIVRRRADERGALELDGPGWGV